MDMGQPRVGLHSPLKGAWGIKQQSPLHSSIDWRNGAAVSPKQNRKNAGGFIKQCAPLPRPPAPRAQASPWSRTPLCAVMCLRKGIE